MKKENLKKIFILFIIISLITLAISIYTSYQTYNLEKSYQFLPVTMVEELAKKLLYINGGLSLLALISLKFKPISILTIIGCIVAVVYVQGINTDLVENKYSLEKQYTVIPKEGALLINVYALNESSLDIITDLQGKNIGTQTNFDVTQQEYALKVVQKECQKNEANVTEYEDIYSLVEALFNKEVDAILLNESYIDVLATTEAYEDIYDQIKVIYTSIQLIEEENTTEAVSQIASEPSVILIGGNDTYSTYNLKATTHAGRTDVNMLLVVNPNTSQILVVTIPRDTYVPFFGDTNKMDKLTHATVYSIQTWKDCVSRLLKTKINYYVRINFGSMESIVDALGGITVENPYSFSWSGYSFPEGIIDLNGKEALMYARVRKYVKDGQQIGDQGRNVHQALVMQALIEKLTSVEKITNFSEIYTAMKGKYSTDIKGEEILALANVQKQNMTNWEVVQYNLTGKMISATSYAMGQGRGPIFDVVILDQNKLNTAIELIDSILAGEVLSIENE